MQLSRTLFAHVFMWLPVVVACKHGCGRFNGQIARCPRVNFTVPDSNSCRIHTNLELLCRWRVFVFLIPNSDFFKKNLNFGELTVT